MSKKKKQKNSKNYKIPLWLHFRPKQVRKGREREKIKINVPFRSLWHRFKPKQVGKSCETEKIKIIDPFRSFSTCNRKLKQKSKKILKIEI